MVNQIDEVWGRNGGNASGDAFDLLELGGADLRPLPLVDGKAMLGKLIAPPAGEIELGPVGKFSNRSERWGILRSVSGP